MKTDELSQLIIDKRLKGEKGALRVKIVLKNKACYYCKYYFEKCERLKAFPPRCREDCKFYNDVILAYGCDRFEFSNDIEIDCASICDKSGNPESCPYYLLGLCD